MMHLVSAYIACANKEQIEQIAKEVIARQTVLLQGRELQLKLLRQQEIKEV